MKDSDTILGSEMEDRRTGQEPDELQVLDPSEYTQHRRLQQIHDARDWINTIQIHGHKLYEQGDLLKEQYNSFVAKAVMEYAIELEPIIVESNLDVLSKTYTVNTKHGKEDVTIRELISTGGRVNGEYMQVELYQEVRRELDKFMQKVNLGVDFVDNSDYPSWEI